MPQGLCKSWVAEHGEIKSTVFVPETLPGYLQFHRLNKADSKVSWYLNTAFQASIERKSNTKYSDKGRNQMFFWLLNSFEPEGCEMNSLRQVWPRGLCDWCQKRGDSLSPTASSKPEIIPFPVKKTCLAGINNICHYQEGMLTLFFSLWLASLMYMQSDYQTKQTG